jgi:hypothetical protein
LTFSTDAPDGGEATDRAVQQALIAQPRVLRAIPRLLAEGFLALQWSRAYVAADIGQMDFWAPGVASMRVLLPKAGTMTQGEAAGFVDGLERASAESRFFGRATSTATWRAETIEVEFTECRWTPHTRTTSYELSAMDRVKITTVASLKTNGAGLA